MKIRPVHLYVTFVCMLAAGTSFLLDWSTFFSLESSSFVGFSALVALALISESNALTITIAQSAGSSSITFIPIVASQLLFGSASTVALVLAVGIPAEVFVRKKPPVRATFNLAQWALAAILAGLAFEAAGGSPLVAPGGDGSAGIPRLILPFIVFTTLFLGINHLAVSSAISLDQNIPFGAVWRNRAGRSAANVFYDILISPIAIAVAFLYLELGLIGILIALLPLLFVRRAYLINYQLQQANRDLLKALVKAIETRDPYTSGHSLRVSQLARRIAEAFGASRKEAEAVETAALLHDVGKIDSIYTEILRKPGDLTKEERRIIQSHVAKGVELLESLSSFGSDVIQAVRHHHERWDGSGYPSGLSGKEIPLGARIIKVCDAIDAMLSDRPYRDALSLSNVRKQLLTHKGTQFDANIVNLVIESSILEEHQMELQMRGKDDDEKKRSSVIPHTQTTLSK